MEQNTKADHVSTRAALMLEAASIIRREGKQDIDLHRLVAEAMNTGYDLGKLTAQSA